MLLERVDEAWVVRYLIVDTGGWLSNRKVLISPFAIGHPDWAQKTLPVSITKEQVKNSPDIDTQKPVSRQHEIRYLGYYGYPYGYAYAPPVVYSAPPPTVYAAPPPAPAAADYQREVVYPHGKYVLEGDGVSTAYHWTWIPSAAPPPPPPLEPRN